MVALIDADDPYHRQCIALAAEITAAMITTWPCFTEAMHLLHRAGGLHAQNDLWAYVAEGSLRLHLPAQHEWQRIYQLMNDYADMPLDLADASLISAAEESGERRLFTVDESLRAIRLRGGKYFEYLG